MTDWSRDLTTHSGFKFHVRPARPDDVVALGAFFAMVTPEDLRFRFLSSMKKVDEDRLKSMTSEDHRQTESFLAVGAKRRCDCGHRHARLRPRP